MKTRTLLVGLFGLLALASTGRESQAQGHGHWNRLRSASADSVAALRPNRTIADGAPHHIQRQSSWGNGHHCNINYRFDYVQLTLLWPPGVCSTSPQPCRRQLNSHFTVHGMWPTLRGTQEPANCCFDNTFDYRAIQPILPELNEYWFSYYDTDNSRSFWQHEWLKHGTCARDVPSLKGELRYFTTTVEMAKRLPIIETLKAAGIEPSNDRILDTSSLIKALAPLSLSRQITFDCDFEHHQPTPLLKGINFCYDANLKPADCPEMKRRCSRQLIWPASATGRLSA